MTEAPVAVIVHHDRPGEQPEQILDALTLRGRRGTVVSVRDLSFEVGASGALLRCMGEEFSPAAVVTQGLNRSWSFVSQILSELESRATPVVNPVAGSTVALDKLATIRALVQAEVPVLDALAVPWGARVTDREPFSGALVTKPNGGSNGQGIVLHGSWEAASSTVSAERALGPDGIVGVELVQPLASGAGVDARVMVVAGEALVTVRRRARRGIVANWNNADVEVWHNAEVTKAAEAAVNAVALAYGAVDLVEHNGQWVVLEVNCWPRDLEVMGRLGGVNVIDRVLALLD